MPSIISQLILIILQYFLKSHFRDEDVEAVRGLVNCLRSALPVSLKLRSLPSFVYRLSMFIFLTTPFFTASSNDF